MTPTPRPQIELLVQNQQHFFNTRETLGYEFRKKNLERLRSAIKTHEGAIHRALKKDLGKPEFEAYGTETGICIHDITQTLKHLKRWMRPKRVRTSILVQPGKSRILYSPLGVNLIIAPYNYPFQLAIAPLTAAIAAGNTVVLKPSEMAPNTSDIICKIIAATFDPELVTAVPGEVEQTTALLAQKFDHIFFTGSTRVGTIVMQAAARHLTPVTLELGGKSPCIVHHDANLDVAARRIVRGKFINVGQTCVAPDYLLVHKSIKKDFLKKLTDRILDCFGKDASTSPDYGRIINRDHLKRIMALIDPSKVVLGGKANENDRFIAPTVMDNITLDDPVMQEEIFGPVLPVIEYDNLEDIYSTIRALPSHPLACYVFSGNKTVQETLTSTIQFGGGCINNSLMHLANPALPFGGVGQSGIGAYHGFSGFECFSHKKSILKSDTWIDLPLFYPPYKNKLSLLRKIMG